jgi:aldose sugar dehydrogenase
MLELRLVAGGLEHPWSVAFLPDGRFLVTERPGRLNLVTPEGVVTRITGLPSVLARNQGGLMEVALHPDFSNNGWVYFSYSRGNWRNNESWLVLARGKLEGERLRGVEELFRQDLPYWPGRHYGGRIAWLPDGTLLLSVGDRGGQSELAQDPAHHFGSVVHLDDQGRPATPEPRFPGDSARAEIFSIGHRNIQGLAVDAAHGRIWATEHGPRGGDELNLIVAGGNYGWPVVTLGRDYGSEAPLGEARSRTGMIDPVYEITPTQAPSGLALVTQARFARWQGNLLAARPRWNRLPHRAGDRAGSRTSEHHRSGER